MNQIKNRLAKVHTALDGMAGYFNSNELAQIKSAVSDAEDRAKARDIADTFFDLAEETGNQMEDCECEMMGLIKAKGREKVEAAFAAWANGYECALNIGRPAAHFIAFLKKHVRD